MNNQNKSVVITADKGKLLAGHQEPFILVLNQGQDLFDSILHFSADAQLPSASLSGLGGLCEIHVAYFNHHTKQYQTQVFQDMHELISINGNITFSEGKHFLHVHAALGNERYEVIGGHIMKATVNPAVELSVIPLNGKIERQFDAGTGLKLICPIVSS